MYFNQSPRTKRPMPWLDEAPLALIRDPHSPNGGETGPPPTSLKGSVSYSDPKSGSLNWGGSNKGEYS